MSFGTVRPTMATLLARLRRMIGDVAATSEEATVWQDTDLQDILDQHAMDIDNERLAPRPAYTGGSVVYQTYLSLYRDYEQTSGGTALFSLSGGSGGTVAASADYTIDYDRGRIVFGADQAAARWYLTGRSYDLHGAAAQVLEEWAAKEPYACITDPINGAQVWVTTKADARTAMADRYRARARIGIPTVRGDVA